MATEEEQQQQLEQARKALGSTIKIVDGGLALTTPVSLSDGLLKFLNAAGVDSELTALLPSGLQTLGANLTEFRFRAELGLTIGVTWATDQSWSITDQSKLLPQARSLRVTLIKSAPELGGGVAVIVGGELSFGDIVVAFQASYPDQALTISATPDVNETWELKTLFTPLALPKTLQSGLPALAIERFILSGDLRANNYTFRLLLAEGESATNSDFPLNNLDLQFNYIGSEVSASLEATVTLDGVPFDAGATFDSERWLFSGESGGNETLGLGEWLAQFSNSLGLTPSPPPQLQNLTVSNGSVSFGLSSLTTATPENVAFGCEVAFPLGEREVVTLVDIEKSKDSLTFSGDMLLGEIALSCRFEQPAGAPALLVAAYAGPSSADLPDEFDADLKNAGQTLALHDLLADAFAEALSFLPKAEVTINGALLAVQAKSAGSPETILFGLDLSNDIDFSGLDLVGDYLADLSLGYQLLLANRPVNDELVTPINEIIPELAADPATYTFPDLPPAVAAGFSLSGQLHAAALGDDGLALLAPFTREDEEAATTAPGEEGGADDALAPSDDKVSWVNIDRAFGPAYFTRLGIAFSRQDGLIFALDMSLTAGPMTFFLYGLSVGSPLEQFEPRFGLDGFGLAYRGGPLEISGDFFLKDGAFVGAALIRAQTFAITAFGEHSQPAGQPASMFLYAFLDKPLGGPAFFFVTGVALGFGYNRDIAMPGIEAVARFPLVAVARGTSEDSDRSAVLAALTEGEMIPPKSDAYWIAAGIKFNSFKLIDSFALLLVRFGRELEFTLLGLSTLALPKQNGRSDNAKVYAEIALRASLKPGDSLVFVEGRLTENSYVIEPGARLGGGFAFYLWYDGQKSGDFVLTLGGYHPRFIPPQHYPRVPRLTLNWPLDENLRILGEAYFALTPSSIMTGGKLEATYEKGELLATFTAYIDFIMGWKPFYYEAEVGLRLLIRYGLLEAELRADMQIWGPEFAGIAEVTWTIFSFTILFGEQQRNRLAETLTWPDFKQSYLPTDEADRQQIGRITLDGGLEKELLVDGDIIWLVRPDALSLATESAIPLTKIQANSPLIGEPIGIRPMNSGTIPSSQTITLTFQRDVTAQPETVDLSTWSSSARRGGVPAELWDFKDANAGGPAANATRSKTPSADILPNRLLGLAGLRPPPPPGLGLESEILKFADLAFTDLDPRLLPLSAGAATTDPIFSPVGEPMLAGFGEIKTTVANTETHRGDILAAVIKAGFTPGTNAQLPKLADEAATAYRLEPIKGTLGSNTIRDWPPVSLAPAPPPPLPEDVAILRSIFVRLWAIFMEFRRAQETAGDDSMAVTGGHFMLDGTTTTITHPGEDIISATAPQPRPVAGTARRSMPRIEVPASSTRAELLPVGKSLLWEIERQSEALEAPLQLDFSVPTMRRDPESDAQVAVTAADIPRVRVVALDRYYDLLNDTTQPAGQPFVLDNRTRYLAVRGLRPEPARQLVVGWHGRSNLLQIQPRALLAEKALVRPQVAQRRRVMGRNYSFGLVSGRQLVANNRINNAGDSSAAGWIETLLPVEIEAGRSLRTIAVLLKRAPDSAATGSPGRPSAHILPSAGNRRNLSFPRPPIAINDSRSDWVYIAGVSSGAISGQDNNIRIRVQVTDPAWQLDGILGLNTHAARIRTRQQWRSFKLEPEAIPASGTQPVAVDVRLTF